MTDALPLIEPLVPQGTSEITRPAPEKVLAGDPVRRTWQVLGALRRDDVIFYR